MRTCWMLLSLLALLATPAAAQEAPPGERGIEAALLHHPIELAGMRKWQRARREWRALPPPRALLTVVNLWARSCPPCLAELPMFQSLIEQWRGRSDVQFLLVADPPAETSPSEVSEFWEHPVVALPKGSTCQGVPLRVDGRPGCVLKLPDLDPWRSEDTRPALVGRVDRRPLTLLVDRHGTIRQVFSGSMEQRKSELNEAIRHLLQALEREIAGRRAEAVPSRVSRPL